ncbi:ChaN family lipoprotein [Vibrio sp. SCSIO 43137]|uniref:ChaN family lipoprotein n=1 Tax=Vibrio sp. SCSIO 43137 TaxID=3021011 RepID=UPI003FCC31C1
MRILSLALLSLLLMACSETQQQWRGDLNTFYSYQLYQDGQRLSVYHLSQKLSDADVILVGEWHSHAGVHKFQTDLLHQLHSRGYPLILAMEQFSRDIQPVMDDYLNDKIGEQTLVKKGKAWSSYESDYRPLVEYAKSAGIDVIAANAPADIVRCISKEGIGFLERLKPEQRSHVAAKVDTGKSAYKDKFTKAMQHGSDEMVERLFAAQISRDATMAESIVKALKQSPDAKVMFVGGKFHTEGGLAMGAEIQRLDPSLKVVVIDPVNSASDESSDPYQLMVMPLPARYLEGEKPEFAHKSAGKKGSLLCSPEKK